ncbi:AAA family ATPase [Conexibacter sp. W3-3-2]|nr:ATP-dependent helicase [Conexibacter sp. W3-3-2]MTD47411.1 AAA family ATPase [Conexibacter sp. W3-3-2]
MREHGRVGVEVLAPVPNLAALRLLLGFVLGPACSLDVRVHVRCPWPWEPEVWARDPQMVDTQVGYAWTVQRLAFRAEQLLGRAATIGPLPASQGDLDRARSAAARALVDGPVQVIAPAGSGKTRVLIERCRLLAAAGVPAQRLLCLTFSRAAAEELQERLAAVGLAQVQVRSFHALGREVLRAGGRLRGGPITAPAGVWRQLAFRAREAVTAAGHRGAWIEPEVLADHVGQTKTIWQRSPAQEFARLDGTAELSERDRTLQVGYALYERWLQRENRVDFDDLVLQAANLLAADAQLRAGWQDRWDAVLVDEHQDTDPGQDRLLRILSAPHDRLTVVADEAQVLFSWRAASVGRVLQIDRTYPAIERHLLRFNYRCHPHITRAAARMIARNAHQFAKPIDVPEHLDLEHRDDPPAARVLHLPTAELTEECARLVREHGETDVALLARTVRTLRQAAVDLARRGVLIRGPRALFEPGPLRAGMLAHLAVLEDPQAASTGDLERMFRTPGRGMVPEWSAAMHRALPQLWDEAAPFSQALEIALSEAASDYPAWLLRRARAAMRELDTVVPAALTRRPRGRPRAARPRRPGPPLRAAGAPGRRRHRRPRRARGTRPPRTARPRRHAHRPARPSPPGAAAPGRAPRRRARRDAQHDPRGQGPRMARGDRLRRLGLRAAPPPQRARGHARPGRPLRPGGRTPPGLRRVHPRAPRAARALRPPGTDQPLLRRSRPPHPRPASRAPLPHPTTQTAPAAALARAPSADAARRGPPRLLF